MARVKLNPDEQIVRAVMEAEWDAQAERISPSVFKGCNISVTRLEIFPMSLVSEIFHRDFNSPPRAVALAIVIGVSKLQTVGQQFSNKPTSLSVEAAPRADNEAHAEIPEKITRGLANKIIEARDRTCQLRRSRLAWTGPFSQRVAIWLWRKTVLFGSFVTRRSFLPRKISN